MCFTMSDRSRGPRFLPEPEAGGAALAVWLFGVPLGTVLLVGLFLICPLMMAGTHGSGHGPNDAFRQSTGRTERAPGKTDAPHRRGAEPRDGN